MLQINDSFLTKLIERSETGSQHNIKIKSEGEDSYHYFAIIKDKKAYVPFDTFLEIYEEKEYTIV